MLSFGYAGKPVILFPTSMGRYYENKDFKLIDSIAWFINNGIVKVYCPDSIDRFSWYNRGIHPALRIKNHIQYDKMVLREIVPRALYETGKQKVITAGCSFGGYHATNFAFKHPEFVSHLINMSAAYDIKDQLDGYYDDNAYFNNPTDYLPDASNPELWKMKIILGTPEHDPCRGANEYLSSLLNRKNIPHWFDLRYGAIHDWPSWREMFPHYLSLL